MLVAFKWLVGSWNPFVNFINIEKSEVYYIISISFEILQNLKLMMQDPTLRKKNKTDFPAESPGAIWLHFFYHLISITHYSSLITHHLIFHTRLASSSNFHHSIFFTLFVGPYLSSDAAFFIFLFFFFSTQTHWS